MNTHSNKAYLCAARKRAKLNIKRLIARSAVDSPVDRILRRDSTLDYQFESFGDWV